MTDMDRILDAAFKAVLPPEKAKKAIARWPIGGQVWRDQVKGKLIDGFGAEDIALHLACHPSHVRDEIAKLRAQGEFAKWWGRP